MLTRKRALEPDYFGPNDIMEIPVEPPSKKKKVYSKILDGTFYTVKCDNDGAIKATCKQCGQDKKGEDSSTGNFMVHYKKMHPDMVAALKVHTKKGNPEKRIKRATLSDAVAVSVTPEQISIKILNFVIDANLSFNVIQLPAFKDLLQTTSGKEIEIPKRFKFMSTLQAQFEKMKEKLIEKLSRQKYLCVTADVWTSRAQSYLGATIHFLNEKYERESYVLAFKQMYSKQTYKELAEALNAIFTEFKINAKVQITNIVTDGGSNFAKMFKVFGHPIDEVTSGFCSEEFPNESGEDLSDVDNAAENVPLTMVDINNEPFVNEILQFDSIYPNNECSSVTRNDDSFDNEATSMINIDNYFGEADNSEAEARIEFPPQRRCFSHIANLIAPDFEKKYLTGIAKTALCQTLSKLHVLWTITHKSSFAKTTCKNILGRMLVAPNETRWNSWFDAVKLVNRIEIKRNLNKLIQQLKSDLSGTHSRNLQTLASNDFSVIEQYVKVFEPVAISLDLLQKEFNSSQGFIMPILISMRHRVSEIEEASSIARDFKAAMLCAIDNRFKEYLVFSEANKDLLLASVSHPRFKTSFIARDEDIAFAKNLLVAECKRMNSEIIEEESTPNASPAHIQEDQFIISYRAPGDRRNSFENEIEAEVNQYLFDERTETNILDRFPNIRPVYFKYNTTVSASSPIERAFSVTNIMYTPRRNRLSAKHFEQALMLQHNRELIGYE